jgi:vacuolar-type H+-ATPase subunit D/Vma8
VERLAVATRAAGILQRKQQALRREEARLGALEEQTSEVWTEAANAADAAHRRAMVLGGRSDLAAAALAAGRADVRVTWRAEMGVELPAETRLEPLPDPAVPGSTALLEATDALRAALAAGVEHAAATTARALVAAELAATQQRLHAVRDRWIPELRRTLAALELDLDEHEREELTRTRSRRAAATGTATREERP